MRFLIEIIKGVFSYMKDLKDKLKKLIASGEDPELVRKLKEILEEEVVEPEPEVLALPKQIELPMEAFSEMRRIMAEKTRLEAILGQYYMKFEAQMQNIKDEIALREEHNIEANLDVIEKYSPDGHASDYSLVSIPATEEEAQKIVLRRKEEKLEE